MSEGTPTDFQFPVGTRTLRSVDEFRREFLPAYYNPEALSARGRETLRLLLEHAPDYGSCLDYGCGIGALTYQLASARPGWRVTGWEGDSSSFAIASECFRLPNLDFELRPYDAYTDLANEAYDSICFLEVIEHVDNPGDILDAFHGALRPGGLLAISTPNVLGYNSLATELWTALRTLLRRKSRDEIVAELNTRSYDATTNQGHVVLYSLATLAALLRSHEFELAGYSYGSHPGRFPRSVFPETLIVVARKPEA